MLGWEAVVMEGGVPEDAETPVGMCVCLQRTVGACRKDWAVECKTLL